MTKKPEKACEDMQKFFKNLLDLKDYVKEAFDETDDEVLGEIYDRLDKIIKKAT